MELIPLFHYFPVDSVMHRTDARIKVLSLFLFSILVFRLAPAGGVVLAVFFLAAIGISKIPFRLIIIPLWPFSILFAVILLAKVYLNNSGVPQLESLREGIVLVIRMLVLLFLGNLYTSTTTFEETRKSISWLLKPFPGNFGFTVATMLSITLAFIPLLFSKAGEIREAQRARNITASKNPIRRIKYFTVQMVITTIESGEQIGDALESRCYGKGRTLHFPALQFSSWLFLLLAGIAAAAALVTPLLLRKLPYTF